MKMQIQVRLDYRLNQPGAAIVVVQAADCDGQIVQDAQIHLGDGDHFARIAADDGIGERLVLHARDRLTCDYNAIVTVTRPRPDWDQLAAVDVEHLPGEALRYLLSSRYCYAERLAHFVASRFGHLAGGAKVAAMRDWVEHSLDYVPGASNADTTAIDTFVDRRGVCRDYAHLLITMCRAAQIPARFAAVYSPHVKPQDFHAVAQIYLDGAWHLADPTGMAQADDMAIIAVGRDATDVAFLTTMTDAEFCELRVEVTPA
ncbi:transglutaminase family protein [Paracoccus sp. (in: a-proteobacteria)]|uniref:transglutaminase-like domain-containing protein n=1 Tax=Paracoccus sp. TaxID=267 RepID=UPI0026DF638D|nr:transglutaminase family protein [Paracoccus sp. (in: a-proteobacteria)]MDO5646414.1 transglutaminase family protein [Paracoccus sp. (in: a-proteobacteria)]